MLVDVQELSPRFKPLQNIRAMEVKLQLTKTVNQMTTLLRNDVLIASPDNVKGIVKRYFDYLESSCASSAETMNHRAEWLLSYGKVVRDLLLEQQNRLIRRSVHTQIIADARLAEQIVKMAAAIADYRLQAKGITQTDISIQIALDEIVEVGSKITPDYTNPAYLKIVDAINTLTDSVEVLKGSTVDVTDMAFSLYTDLSRINYSLVQFLLHKDLDQS